MWLEGELEGEKGTAAALGGNELEQRLELAIIPGEAVRVAVGQLRDALQSNRTTGTAVGMVMTRYELDAQQAFKVLVRISQTPGGTVRTTATRRTTRRPA